MPPLSSIPNPVVLRMTGLSELFAEQQTNVIDWNGPQIYGLFEFNEVPSRTRLTFATSVEAPAARSPDEDG